MSIVYIEKVTEKGGIEKTALDEDTLESQLVHIDEGEYIIYYNNPGNLDPAEDWAQMDFAYLQKGYKPIDGQKMGEDGQYETIQEPVGKLV